MRLRARQPNLIRSARSNEAFEKEPPSRDLRNRGEPYAVRKLYQQTDDRFNPHTRPIHIPRSCDPIPRTVGSVVRKWRSRRGPRVPARSDFGARLNSASLPANGILGEAWRDPNASKARRIPLTWESTASAVDHQQAAVEIFRLSGGVESRTRDESSPTIAPFSARSAAILALHTGFAQRYVGSPVSVDTLRGLRSSLSSITIVIELTVSETSKSVSDSCLFHHAFFRRLLPTSSVSPLSRLTSGTPCQAQYCATA